jgi:copper transport protein
LVFAELGVTVVVLGLSSVLVQTTPGRTAVTTPAASTVSYYDKTLANQLYSLEIQIDPAKVGNNSIHLFAFTPAGAPLTVAEWKATAALPENGIQPITVPLLQITESHAIAEVELPNPGVWQISFTLRTTEIDQATVTASVPVS